VTQTLANPTPATLSAQEMVPRPSLKFSWTFFLFLVATHIAALGSFYFFSWPAVVLCVVFHWITGGLGITLGYHRLLTHRSFKTPKWVEYTLAFIGNLAGESDPASWVTTHRLHHTYSDTELDPHTPLRSFMWAHMTWIFYADKRTADRQEQAKVAPELVNDRFYHFLAKTHILWNFVLGGLFYAWGGWPFVFWGIFMRLVLVYHSTWLVNSAAHVWGYETYKTDDTSKNNWWVALLTYGEGWHNNHHAFLYSSRHGLKWWEIDTTYMMIWFMEKIGLAQAVKIPSKRLLASEYAPGKQNL